MPAKKKTSVQNTQLTMDEILSVLADMEKFRESIKKKKRQLTNHEQKLPLTAKNSQERMLMQREIDKLEHDIQRQTKLRFEKFLRLIVRVRNLGSVKGSYTKSNFMSEVKHYLDLVA